jgi:hypothetical protein
MKVSRLVAQIPKLRNLNLAKTTFYALTNEDEDLLPEIIAALVKSGATKTQLKPAAAKKVIRFVRLRHEYGNFHDATLLALHDWCRTVPASESDPVVAALKRANPSTKEEAEKIVAAAEKIVAATLAKAAKIRHVEQPMQEVEVRVADSPVPSYSDVRDSSQDDLPRPDTSDASSPIPAELEQIAAQVTEIIEGPLDQFKVLVAIWDAATEDVRRRFLEHIGARLLQ